MEKTASQGIMDKLIIDYWQIGQHTKYIADLLNLNEFKTITGKEWTEGTVSAYARRNLNLEKRRNRPVGIKKNVENKKVIQEDLMTKVNFQTKPSTIEIIEEVKEEAKTETQEPNFNPSAIVVFEKSGKFWTDSRAVAEVFGKRHDHVLRDIAKLECTDKFRLLNFGESSYINSQNKVQPKVELTKDGFTLLAFGFTGKKAMEFKELYIEKFNEMEEALKNQKPKVLTIEEHLMLTSQALVEHRKDINQLKESVKETNAKADYALEQMNEIKQTNKEAREKLSQEVEYSNRPPLELSLRAKIKKVVDNYVANKFLVVDSGTYTSVWGQVDKEFYDRYRFNLKIRKQTASKNLRKEVSRLDIAEDLGLLPQLFDIVSYLFKVV